MIKLIIALLVTGSLSGSQPAPQEKKEQFKRTILRRSGISVRCNLNDIVKGSSNYDVPPLRDESALLKVIQKRDRIERKIERKRKEAKMMSIIRDMWQ